MNKNKHQLRNSRPATSRLRLYMCCLALLPWMVLDSPAVAQVGRNERVEVLRFTIRPNGIAPSELTRPAGKHLIIVDIRNLAADLTLRLNRESGEQIHESRLRRGQYRFSKVLPLAAGRYILQVPGMPRWRAQITIAGTR